MDKKLLEEAMADLPKENEDAIKSKTATYEACVFCCITQIS